MLKAIIFDFDYTLGDSTKGIVESANYALGQLGYAAGSVADIKKTVGLTLRETYHALTSDDDGDRAEQFIRFFKQKADCVMVDNTELYAGVTEVLRDLRAKGYQIAIVSTKFHYRIEQILKKYNAGQLIDLIIGAEDVKVEKPSPEGLLRAIDYLHVAKEEVLYVGDSFVDAKTAENAKVAFAAVLTGTTTREEFAAYPKVYVGNNISDIYHYISAAEENPAAVSANRPTALITGASRGIGKAIAETFAAAGYELFLTCSKTIDELHALAARLTETYQVPCHLFQADSGKYEEVAQLFTNMKASAPSFRDNGLDVLVNNAGISYVGLLTDMTPEEWHRVISVNLDSCFYTCRQAIPLMLQNHAGRIINISSVWGNVGASMEVAYSASKGGINAFTKALAKELAPSNIQVNAIACGVIDTSMNACFSPEDIDALKEEIPTDRLGTPEEVAQLTLQLAQAPAYLTGQIITLDGGWQ